MTPTKQQLDAGLQAHYALKDSGPKPVSMAKDPEAHVAVIAQAVLDNEAWDRVEVVRQLRDWADSLDNGNDVDWVADKLRELAADLMEGGE